jgi:uncharacterized damage-inducible protein DinB
LKLCCFQEESPFLCDTNDVMTKDSLLADLEQTTQAFAEAVSGFSQESFNQKPSNTAWSAAQIAEHLLKVGHSTYKAITVETIPTNRPPEQKIALIRQAMEDETIKRIAPERVQPSANEQETGRVVEQIQKQKLMLEEAVRSSDLTDACMSFKHPALGTLTKIEWLYFHIYHVQRHLRQLKRLQERTTAQ